MKARVSTMYVGERAFMHQVTCKFAPTQPPSLTMVQRTPLERTVFLRRFRTTHINFWRKERPTYREQPFTGVPQVIEQILWFGKCKHLPRDKESVIIRDGLDGQPFREGGSETPTLQPEIDRLRQDKRERGAKKQAKHAQQVLEKGQHTPCVAAPPRADVASSSSSLTQPSQSSQPPVATQSQPQSDSNEKGKERAPAHNPLWLLNLNPNPIITARERREPFLHNPNHRLKKTKNAMNPEHSPTTRCNNEQTNGRQDLGDVARGT